MKLQTLATACLAIATLAGCDAVGDGIGPEGGVVTSLDGRITLDVPEGALDQPVEITIEEVEDVPEDALGPAYRIEPVGLVFDAPVHVVYNYGARGMEVEPADVFLVVEREQGWNKLPDRHVFGDEGIVSATTLYLSTFCVIEAP